MADILMQDSTMEAIADAIRSKTGGSAKMTPSAMASNILSIASSSSATVTTTGFMGNGSSSFTISNVESKPTAIMIFPENGQSITATGSVMSTFCGLFSKLDESVLIFGWNSSGTFTSSAIQSSAITYNSSTKNLTISISASGMYTKSSSTYSARLIY